MPSLLDEITFPRRAGQDLGKKGKERGERGTGLSCEKGECRKRLSTLSRVCIKLPIDIKSPISISISCLTAFRFRPSSNVVGYWTGISAGCSFQDLININGCALELLSPWVHRPARARWVVLTSSRFFPSVLRPTAKCPLRRPFRICLSWLITDR